MFIFFGFVPLLMVEDALASANPPRRALKVFGWSYLTFLLWNIAVTWWVFCVQFGKEGAVMAWLANALLMAIVFTVFSGIKKRIGKPWALWLFIPVWLSWEYLHGVWDLAWIWLNLGNVFSFNHRWIQWYEFTGASGGTLWALLVNVIIFKTVKERSSSTLFSNPALKAGALILLPMGISYLMYFSAKPLSETSNETYRTLVVQPNNDPYEEKFDTDYEVMFLNMLGQIRGRISDKTEYLVLPETFITGLDWYGLDESKMSVSPEVLWMKDSLIKTHPKLKIVVGASSIYIYGKNEKVSVTARRDQSGVYFDCYNTAMQIDTSGVQLYHKSKLVPGVERMPFPALLKPLEKLAIDLGGTSGSLGTQEERVSFTSYGGKLGVAPVICYESVFADYVAEYIRKGATFIFIVTNDGWWEDTPGYWHHLNYAKLRAIENRRQIARSANTGVSCFIDEKGNVSEATTFWEEAVIEKDLNPNRELTFFSRFGDLISYSAVFITILSIVFALVLRLRK